MPQLELGTQPFQNRGVFRDHYLLHRLPAEQPEWSEDVEALRVQVQGLFQRAEPGAPQLNEATLEGDLIRPVLEALGFRHEEWVEKQDAQALEPDYTVFGTLADKRDALGRRGDGTFYEKSLCLVEAKAWTVDLDRRVGRERSPMAQLKRYLVESGVTWGILTNGREWRLLKRDGSVDRCYAVRLDSILARPAREFRYFSLFFRRRALESDFLRRVERESRRYAERVEADLRDRVREALVALGRGLLAAERARRGDPGWIPDQASLRTLFDAAMLALYRLLFALYAEARRLLPLGSPAYRRYSMRALAEDVASHIGTTREPSDFAALSTTVGAWYDRARSLWTLVERGEGTPGADLYVPRYNGGLFKSDAALETPLTPAARLLADGGVKIPDRWFAEAVDILARTPVNGALDFVDYAGLRERQLGSMYEGLLELSFRMAAGPTLAVRRGGKDVWLAAEEATGSDVVLERVESGDLYAETDAGERKATGAFYTPQWVVEYIVEQALEPLLAERSASLARERPRPSPDSVRQRFLDVRVLDPAMGSGHFLVEALDYIATWIATDPSYEPAEDDAEADLAELRRLVAEHCIYGVDVSYLAVELAKLSMWLRTMVFGKPLDFLDHHLRWGNSVVGIADLGELAQVGEASEADDEQLVFPMNHAVSRTQRVAAFLEHIGLVATNNIGDVILKEELLAQADQERADLRRVADLHTSFRFGETLRTRRNELLALEHQQVRQADIFGDDQHRLDLFGRRGLRDLDDTFYHTVARTLGDRLINLGQLDRFVAEATAIARRHKAFHWPIEFPDVWFTERGWRAQPGFDAVIGNPPYVRMERFKDIKQFLGKAYATHESRADLYVYFVERAHRLLRPGGRFGMILSNKFLRANYGGPLRAFLAERVAVEQIVDFGELPVFEGAATMPAIVVTSSSARRSDCVRYAVVKSLDFERLETALTQIWAEVPTKNLEGADWVIAPREAVDLLANLERASIPLGDYVEGRINWGVKSGLNEAFYIDGATRARILAGNPDATEVIKPLVVGDDIRRYHVRPSDAWLLYMYHGVNIRKYPAVERHLLRFKEQLLRRATKQEWYELQQPQMAYVPLFEAKKIAYPEIAREPRFAELNEGVYVNNKCFVLPEDAPWLLAMLNTQLLFDVLRHLCSTLGDPHAGGRLELRAQYMARLPVRRFSEKRPVDDAEALRLREAAERLAHEEVLSLVEPLLPLTANSTPDLANERSAPIRDLLTHLGKRLTELHAERQAITKHLGDWLEYSGIESERLPVSFREGGWADLNSSHDVLAEFRKRRVRLAGQQLADCQRELNHAFERLGPVRHRISVLDDLTERVVRRLYGVEALPPSASLLAPQGSA
jgi:hypothetical protein